MGEETLKSKTFKGFLWNGIENVANLGLQFIIGIVLARLLSPKEYGIIAIVFVFVGISNIMISGGFSYALIRKNDRTESDYTTAFTFNMVTAVVLYLILFFAAPAIAAFYELPILVSVTRVICLTFIFGALCVIQNAVLEINLNFRTSAKVTLISNLLGGGVGITMAYLGFGVWSLVSQTVSVQLFRSVLLWTLIRWTPKAKPSKASFKDLFGYGFKLMLSGLVGALYQNLYNLIIGKLFTAHALGLYSKAKSFASLPSSTLNNIVQRVSFPSLSKVQDDRERLMLNFRKLIKMMGFIVFPATLLFFGIADPMIRFILTDKWAGCIPLLQILCFSVLLMPIQSLNISMLQVIGRSDRVLQLNIINKVIGVAIIVVSWRWGVVGMCYGALAASLIEQVIDTSVVGRLTKVGFVQQLKDILPMLLYSIIAGIAALLIVRLPIEYNIVKCIAGAAVFALLYFGLNLIFKTEAMHDAIDLIKTRGK